LLIPQDAKSCARAAHLEWVVGQPDGGEGRPQDAVEIERQVSGSHPARFDARHLREIVEELQPGRGFRGDPVRACGGLRIHFPAGEQGRRGLDPREWIAELVRDDRHVLLSEPQLLLELCALATEHRRSGPQPSDQDGDEDVYGGAADAVQRDDRRGSIHAAREDLVDQHERERRRRRRHDAARHPDPGAGENDRHQVGRSKVDLEAAAADEVVDPCDHNDER